MCTANTLYVQYMHEMPSRFHNIFIGHPCMMDRDERGEREERERRGGRLEGGKGACVV